MHKILSKSQSLLFKLIPKNNKYIYSLCRRYIDHYDGFNNSDMITNGELRVLKQIIPSCNLIFDVGANIGNWTQIALNLNPQLHVHAFEPHLPTFEILRAQSFPKNVHLQPFGLSSSAGKRILYVQENHTGLNSIYERDTLLQHQDYKGVIPLEIQLNTIDIYCQENQIEMIDYLKIDVEGHDLDVLLGAEETLKKNKIQIIQFEYGGTSLDARVLLKDFFTLLQPLHYVLYKIHPSHLQKFSHYSYPLENFQYQNWLAIHTELGANLIRTL